MNSLKPIFLIPVKIIMGVIFTYAFCLIAINSSAPLGLHVSIAITEGSGAAKTIEEKFFDLFFWRDLSSILVKKSKNKCDLPRAEYYRKDIHAMDLSRAVFSEETIPGKNERIVFLVTNHKKDGFNSKRIMEYILNSVDACDINIHSGDDYSPIILAILFGDIEIVDLLISKNVELKRKIYRPGKPIDGLNSLEFATLLESKADTEEKKNTYSSIIQILQEKIQKETHQSQT